VKAANASKSPIPAIATPRTPATGVLPKPDCRRSLYEDACS